MSRTTPRRATLRTTVIAIAVAAATTGCATTGTDVATPPTSNTSVATPGSPSSIGVTVTLVDEVITAVTVTPRATDSTSLDYQTRFAQAIPALVVGRHIDEVNLSKVAGSSGTPDGFNAAIQRIKAEATTR